MDSKTLTSSRTWREMQGNARCEGVDVPTDNSGHFFDTKRPHLKYPQQLEKHHNPVSYNREDPYAHLGRIGYRRNTYQFRGPNKDDNNIYGAQHMKKTAWMEEMRRRLISEEHGITAEVDESSLTGTADAFYVTSREKRNKYIKKTDIVGQAWTTSTLKPTSSDKTKT
jgi:hypothetical protein